MFSKTISYEDYKGNKREETFYFHLSKAELVEMQMTTEGGLHDALERIIESQNVPEIYKWFKKFILASYGERSGDGKRFIKSEELSTAFSQTEAYSNLIMEMFEHPDKAAEFMNSLVPKNIDVENIAPRA